MVNKGIIKSNFEELKIDISQILFYSKDSSDLTIKKH